MAAGCGSQPSPGAAPASQAAPPSLATSLVTATGTWAVTVMGGTAASHNNFWQLFVRPAGTSTWRLATPPGVASNGGFVLAGATSGALLAGFRPSQRLSYSPLAATSDNGRSWSPGLLDAGLADVPGALAADPASGRRLALLTSGGIDMSAPGGTAWTRLATRQGLARSAAGLQCGLVSLTAAAFSKTGTPMLGASCTHSRIAGIYSEAGGTWHLAGPALPAAYAHQPSTVLRLGTAGGTTTALLETGTGPAGRPDGGLVSRRRPALGAIRGPSGWTAPPSPPRRPGQGMPSAVVLTGGRAAFITGPGTSMAGAAPAARRHRRAGIGTGRWLGRPRRSPHHAHRLAGRTRLSAVDQHPGHQGSRPVRLVRMTPPGRSARQSGARPVAPRSPGQPAPPLQ